MALRLQATRRRLFPDMHLVGLERDAGGALRVAMVTSAIFLFRSVYYGLVIRAEALVFPRGCGTRS